MGQIIYPGPHASVDVYLSTGMVTLLRNVQYVVPDVDEVKLLGQGWLPGDDGVPSIMPPVPTTPVWRQAAVNVRGATDGARVVFDGASESGFSLSTESSYVINGGNLGSTYSPTLGNKPDVLVVGTLNANCSIALPTPVSAGSSLTFELHQDATGGRSVTFSSAVLPSGALAVNQAALTVTVVSFYSPDGTSWVGLSSASTTTLPKYDRDSGQPGMFCVDHLSGPSVSPVTADDLLLSRFVPTRDMVVTGITFAVATASAVDAACQFGIYDSSLNLIASTPQTTGVITSQGAKNVLLSSSVTLVAGTVYYAAGVLHGGDASLRVVTWTIASFTAARMLGSGPPTSLGLKKSATWPLTNPLTGASDQSTNYLLAVRE